MSGWYLEGGTTLHRPQGEVLPPRLHLWIPVIYHRDNASLKVDWGDGSIVQVDAYDAAALSRFAWHDYPQPGRYAVSAQLDVSCDGFTRHWDRLPMASPRFALPGPAEPSLTVDVTEGYDVDRRRRRSLLRVSLAASRPAPLLVRVEDEGGRVLFEHRQPGLMACGLQLQPILPDGAPCLCRAVWGVDPALSASLPFEAIERDALSRGGGLG